MLSKSLDEKLLALRDDPTADCFILADAKDADMAFGLQACGRHWPPHASLPEYRSIEEYTAIADSVAEQGLVDISLLSASTAGRLAARFENYSVTPAVRMNDTTDIWLAGTPGSYQTQRSLPFSTTSIDAVMGRSTGGQSQTKRQSIANLGLYSITLNRHARRDRETLEGFRRFRSEACEKKFRYFLEIFPPNRACGLAKEDIAQFVADSIVRLLAGVVAEERPIFLKVPYLGPELTEQLCRYDRSVIVGVMGGAAGTTHDAFKLVDDARRSGVRAALFGRKINDAEDQRLYVDHLRKVADRKLSPDQAVRSYHDQLAERSIPSKRELDADLATTAASAGLADYNNPAD